MKQTTNKRPTVNTPAPTAANGQRPSPAPHDTSASGIPTGSAPMPARKHPAPIPRLEPATPPTAATAAPARSLPIGKKTPPRPARPGRAVPRLGATSASRPASGSVPRLDTEPAPRRDVEPAPRRDVEPAPRHDDRAVRPADAEATPSAPAETAHRLPAGMANPSVEDVAPTSTDAAQPTSTDSEGRQPAENARPASGSVNTPKPGHKKQKKARPAKGASAPFAEVAAAPQPAGPPAPESVRAAEPAGSPEPALRPAHLPAPMSAPSAKIPAPKATSPVPLLTASSAPVPKLDGPGRDATNAPAAKVAPRPKIGPGAKAAPGVKIGPDAKIARPAPRPAAKPRRAGNRATVIALVPVAVLVGLLGVSTVTALNVSAAPTQRAAEDWLMDNVARDQRLIVDSAMSTDLKAAGWDGDDELWTVPADGDIAQAESPSSWRDADYVVTTGALRDRADELPQVAAAIDNSVAVASFGSGQNVIEIREVAVEGAVLSSVAQNEAVATRAQFGAELAENPGVQVSDADRGLMTAGRVDARILGMLGGVAAEGDVAVAGFPVVGGEQDRPFRQVAISAVGGQPLVVDGQRTAAASALIDGLIGQFAPDDIAVRAGTLVLRYSSSVDGFLD